jgi:hypothetical protein
MKKIQFLTQEDFTDFVKSSRNQDLISFSVVDKKTGEDLSVLIFSELRKVNENNRSLIILSNSFFELLLNHLVKKLLKSQKIILNDNRTYSYAVKLTILFELGIVNKSEFDRLNILRKIRNDFSHSPFFDLNQNDLKVLNENGGNTYFILVFFITEFWNNHIENLKDLNK